MGYVIWKNGGTTYEDATRIRDRKSMDMVEYLRERRSAGPLVAFFRRRHLARSISKGEPD